MVAVAKHAIHTRLGVVVLHSRVTHAAYDQKAFSDLLIF